MSIPKPLHMSQCFHSIRTHPELFCQILFWYLSYLYAIDCFILWWIYVHYIVYAIYIYVHVHWFQLIVYVRNELCYVTITKRRFRKCIKLHCIDFFFKHIYTLKQNLKGSKIYILHTYEILRQCVRNITVTKIKQTIICAVLVYLQGTMVRCYEN